LADALNAWSFSSLLEQAATLAPAQATSGQFLTTPTSTRNNDDFILKCRSIYFPPSDHSILAISISWFSIPLPFGHELGQKKADFRKITSMARTMESAIAKG
jgi:hypothetical protein